MNRDAGYFRKPNLIGTISESGNRANARMSQFSYDLLYAAYNQVIGA